MVSIYLKQAENVEQVDAILRDPELFSRIAEDGVEDYVTPFDGNQCYMMLMEGDLPIGVWNLYPINTVTLNIHCNILKEHREHGKEAGRLILEWFVINAPVQYQKLNAEIPFTYPEVYHFTKNFGFQDEGINRLSISKNGQLVDQWRLGITRQEVANLIQEAA